MGLGRRNRRRRTHTRSGVCIVGAGPAGLALAAALQPSGLAVVLIESGRHNRDGQADQLNRGESLGDPFPDLMTVRSRTIAARRPSGTPWSGECPTRYLPLDRIDFESRDWVPESGWPMTRAMLDPYYRRAEVAAGLRPGW